MADWTDTQLPENIMTTLEVDDLAVNYDISAGTVYSKNSCTAWVNFDGTTTPPTIRDSFNVSDVVRTATGRFEVYFEEAMDNTLYNFIGTSRRIDNSLTSHTIVSTTLDDIKSTSLFAITSGYVTSGSGLQNQPEINITIFGGKN